jgi:MFS family permease
MRKITLLILLLLLNLKLFASPSDSLIIELINGERIYNVKIVELRDDSLIIDENGQLWSVGLNDIGKIIIGKKSRFWEFAVKGAVAGFTIGIIPGLVVIGAVLERGSGDRYKEIGIVLGLMIAGVGGAVGLVAGGLIGGVIGEILGKDKVYDFSKMSQIEKVEILQKLKVRYGAIKG